MSSFKELALNINILNALEQKGYFEPTPIQAQAIPQILLGKDFLGIAQTGTGKTAAFSLPILHLLSDHQNNGNKNPRALVLTPTRELASQIVDNVEFYGKELNLRYAVIFGGVSDNEQIKIISKGVDIVVATPGRLIDLLQQRAINLQDIKIFVLDEADRMLDMGFIVDVKRIVKQLPKQRQNLFFSEHNFS
jgi:ATP-dependent RNA helicase RhlE